MRDEELFPVPAPEPRPGRLHPEPPPALLITAFGEPAPQGSKTLMPNGRMVEASSKLEPWRNAVASYTMVARSRVRGWRPLTGPIEVSMVFTLARPRSHYGTGANTGKLRPSAPLRPDVKPDLDKLARATGDALKMGQAYKDDALVVGFRTLSKHYPEDHSWVADVLHKPGCVIRLWPLTAQGVR